MDPIDTMLAEIKAEAAHHAHEAATHRINLGDYRVALSRYVQKLAVYMDTHDLSAADRRRLTDFIATELKDAWGIPYITNYS